MKVTVDISDSDLNEIMKSSGIKKKGPAIIKFITTGLMLQRRRELSNKVLAGEVRVEFAEAEKLQELDRDKLWTK